MTASFLFNQGATLLGWASKDSPGTDKPLLLHSHLSPPFHRALLQPVRRAAFTEPAVNSVLSLLLPHHLVSHNPSLSPLFWKQPGLRAGVRTSSMHGPPWAAPTRPSPLPSSCGLCGLVHLPASRPLARGSGSSDIPPVSGLSCASTQYQINSALPLQTSSRFFIISSFPSSCLPPSCFNLILFPTPGKNYYGIPALLQEPLETPPAVHPGKGQPEAAAAPSWLWLPSRGHT